MSDDNFNIADYDFDDEKGPTVKSIKMSDTMGQNSDSKNKGIKLNSEDFYILSLLPDNILKMSINILYEETIKYENGVALAPKIDFVISLATDRIKIQQYLETKGKEKETVCQNPEKIRENRNKWLDNL